MSRAPISRISIVFAALLLVPGCRTATPTSSSSSQIAPVGSPAVRPTADVLRREEIRTANVNDAFEALVRFRPELLKRRAVTATADWDGGLPVVYVNGIRQGGLDVLRSIPARVVVEIRYLRATAAASQFGPLHEGAVLAVRTDP